MHHPSSTLSGYCKALVLQYKLYFMLLFCLAVTSSIFHVSVDYKIKEIIDIISSNPSTSVGSLVLLFAVYKFLYHGMFFLVRLLNIKYDPEILSQTIEVMYQDTTEHSLHWFDSHLSGEIASKISDFQSSIATVIKFSPRIICNIAMVIISILFLLRVHVLPAMVVLVFALVYTPILMLLLNKQRSLIKDVFTAKQEALGIVNDSISNIFGIKIIGSVVSELKYKLLPAVFQWRNKDRTARKFDAYFVDNADTVLITIMAGTLIYLSASLYQQGEITAGGFAFISLTLLSIHAEIESFLDNLLFNINPALASMKASYAFIRAPKDTVDDDKAPVLSHVTGHIQFQDVDFAYDKTLPDVLQGFNLDIPARQRIGIVGTSGAGKTTIIKCLLRYFDVRSGHIRIDGQDIDKVTQVSLRAHISMIPQDITMFHRSILDNLRLAKYDATEAEIMEACKKARVHEDIMRMPQGYHTIVGERGVKVSGGQRQRIAIARAILKNAPILILDEATSALDTPTEKLIQASLNEMFDSTGMTTIVVAHRLSTLLHMDRILVIAQGQIVEDGTHTSLLAQNGLYKTLWDAQVGGFLPG